MAVLEVSDEAGVCGLPGEHRASCGAGHRWEVERHHVSERSEVIEGSVGGNSCDRNGTNPIRSLRL